MNKLALLLLVLMIAAWGGREPALGQAPGPAQQAYLFTSFRGNGEDGLHLAYSFDGYNWKALKNDQSFLRGTVGDKLVRDPCIRRGPDGIFRMVWTTGWMEQGFGYASSQDLLTWSEQIFVPVGKDLEGATNVWAPELFFDQKKDQWLVIWATTIKGLFPASENDDGGHNHRQYYTTTRDFKEFSKAKLFYDPGFCCIDGTLIEEDGKYHFIFKDERVGKKCLKMTTADNAGGPFPSATETFTRDWVEGPSAIKMGSHWFVFYDHYTDPHYYGALRSGDLVHWEDVSDKMSFPGDFRHGTVIEIDSSTLTGLLR